MDLFQLGVSCPEAREKPVNTPVITAQKAKAAMHKRNGATTIISYLSTVSKRNIFNQSAPDHGLQVEDLGRKISSLTLL
jgi:hypothetical protein